MNFIKIFLAALLATIVGSLVITFLWIMLFVGLSASMGKDVTVADSSILVIDFEEQVVDAPSGSPFGSIDFNTLEITPEMTLMRALRAIEMAADDDRIKGIYIRPNGKGGASLSILEELREAIGKFKQSGKFVVAYNETYGMPGYYFSSVADKIYLHPQGGMDWKGMSMTLPFYKGLFDKLDISYEIFRPTVCKYKSAVEPYFMEKMSPANREQMQQLVESMWSVLSGTVARDRGIEPDLLAELTDKLLLAQPEDALKYNMVDALIYEDQLKDVFAELGVEADEEGEYEMVTLGKYAAQIMPQIAFNSDQVAVVYAQGAIYDGKGGTDAIYGNDLAAKIAEVRKDDAVKAVVLRVNSPGGSAIASDVVWREMELLRAEKPVVVSMGSYAASGGYYISAPADVIVADRTTLTGSIGVFGAFPVIGEALERKAGITFDGVKTNTSADFGQSFMGLGTIRPVTQLERNAIMRSVDKVYETFTTVVAEGRNLPIERVLEIAGGRVWSGVDALGLGLIDSYGGLQTAIGIAASKAELGDDYVVYEVVDEQTGLAALFSGLLPSIRAQVASDELGIALRPYRKAQELLSQKGILMYCPYAQEIR